MKGKQRVAAFSLAEILLGIGMAAVLLLTVLLLTTSALQSDQKVETRHVAAALAESQLESLGRTIASPGAAARDAFWSAPDGILGGLGLPSTMTSNGTEFSLQFTATTLLDSSGQPLGGNGNRMRQVEAEVEWWNGEKGRPGYGQLKVRRTLVVRESDVLVD